MRPPGHAGPEFDTRLRENWVGHLRWALRGPDDVVFQPRIIRGRCTWLESLLGRSSTRFFGWASGRSLWIGRRSHPMRHRFKRRPTRGNAGELHSRLAGSEKLCCIAPTDRSRRSTLTVTTPSVIRADRRAATPVSTLTAHLDATLRALCGAVAEKKSPMVTAKKGSAEAPGTAATAELLLLG